MDYMRYKFNFWKLSIIFICLVIAILLIAEWTSGIRDGRVEEMVEDIIEHQTGIEIDLSRETGYLP